MRVRAVRGSGSGHGHGGRGTLAAGGLEWLLGSAKPIGPGLAWTGTRDGDEIDPTLYSGAAGIVITLLEAHRDFRDDRYADAAIRASRALAGAADVVSRNEAGPSGFLVPHSDPQHRPDRIERYSFGWCHGPAGDAQVFRMLGAVTRDPAWPVLADRCWHTVTASGLPRRIRPGFWDNNGRCCGTAGVLALACDRHAEAAGT